MVELVLPGLLEENPESGQGEGNPSHKHAICPAESLSSLLCGEKGYQLEHRHDLHIKINGNLGPHRRQGGT